MQAKPVPRPANKGCVRYELVYVQPHLGGDQWGPREFSDLVYPDGPGSYRYYGQYAACPATAPVEAEPVQLWKDWRKIRMADRQTYWSYTETVANADVAPVAMVPRTPTTISKEGVLYRVQIYDGYFAGCDFWATSDRDYQCVK
jgi:hypothetical protein